MRALLTLLLLAGNPTNRDLFATRRALMSRSCGRLEALAREQARFNNRAEAQWNVSCAAKGAETDDPRCRALSTLLIEGRQDFDDVVWVLLRKCGAPGGVE